MSYTFNGAVELLGRLSIPRDNIEYFAEHIAAVEANEAHNGELRMAVERFQGDESVSIDSLLPTLSDIAQRYGENRWTEHFLFLLANTYTLRQTYAVKNVSEEIYLRSMDDLHCKNAECVECKGVPGTFVAGWYDRFFRFTRFGLGRFQFETHDFWDADEYKSSCGYVVKRGDPVVGMHIPSSGIPLTDEVRLDSYRRAYKFYRDYFKSDYAVFTCGSWLLYDKQREFLPAGSNILKFLGDFELLHSEDSDSFGDAWRVFGHWADLPLEQWPTDTSLRAAYVNRLKAGKKTGHGNGVIIFDGEKILR